MHFALVASLSIRLGGSAWYYGRSAREGEAEQEEEAGIGHGMYARTRLASRATEINRVHVLRPLSIIILSYISICHLDLSAMQYISILKDGELLASHKRESL